MKTKTLTVEVKAIDLDEGQFEGYAAVFGNKDSYGDVIQPGAFADTLAEDYGENGKGVPVYWCHDFTDPFKNIGSTLWAKEDTRGLRVRVQLDLDTQNAKQTLKLLKDGRVNQMSFGYTVLEGAFVESEEHGFFYELRKLKLHEVSVVPIGANQETEILAAKSDVTEDAHADLKELLKSTAESLALARGAFLLAADAAKSLGIELPDDVSGTPEASASETDHPVEETPVSAHQEPADELSDAKAEEPSGVKAEEPTIVPTARALAQATIHRFHAEA